MFRSIRQVLLRSWFLLFAVVSLNSCNNSPEGCLIVTETLSGDPKIFNGETERYQNQSRLILVNPEKKGNLGKNITEGFYSACSPDVSFDGKLLVFAGQKNQGDPWQIWKMDLNKLKAEQVTRFNDHSTDPAFLPGNKIVFSHQITNDSIKAGHSLFSCNLDGSNMQRLTFNPNTYLGSTVLKDGRIIAASRQVFPEKSGSVLMVLRPDGTKAELFYHGEKDSELIGRGIETENAKICLVEAADSAFEKVTLVEISYNRPLNSHKEIGPENIFFNSVAAGKQGKLLVSCKKTGETHFSVFEYDPQKESFGEPIYSSDVDAIGAVWIYPKEQPRKLPSEVDFGVKTGLLLCQNINLTGLNSPETGFLHSTSNKIELLGLNESLGITNVEKDGSVYMKIAADIPFRIQTLDSLGNVINGPGAWYYLRPNERRGCVGCHEDNEIAPANRYALAVGKNPVVFPIHVTGIKEKEVELE